MLDKAPGYAEKEDSMSSINSKFIGLSQYKAAFNYELSGKNFHFVMDCGREYSLNFLDGENIQIAEKGEPYKWESYECMKGDPTTFLVHIMPTAGKGLINWTFVIDTLQALVTLVIMEEGYDPEYPRLIRVTPYFGAVKRPGCELPAIRHHLTNRMVGKHIFWHYRPGFAIQHLYVKENMIRANYGPKGDDEQYARLENEAKDPDPEVAANAAAILKRLRSRQVFYPYYEEPSFHIWINETLNLMCFVEENMNRLDPERKQGGGGILLLQDIERVTDVGVCFSAGEYYMCSAFGEECEEDDPMLRRESVYDWSKFDAMPSIRWEVPEE